MVPNLVQMVRRKTDFNHLNGKKKLNDKITGSWQLASEYGAIFDFAYGFQTLVYYLTNKRINTGNYRACTYK